MDTSPATPTPDAPRWATQTIVLATLAVLALLLLTRLGHYALWDDEAGTALEAKGILRTGDTSIVMDHGNYVFYLNAMLVRNFHDRSTPPLASYLAALSFALFGESAWSARLPFALLGLATAWLLLRWAARAGVVPLAVFALALLGNVSLLLYFRQCRYYGPAIFFSAAVAWVYWHWRGGTRGLLALAGLSVLLFLSNYLNYLALYACLAMDYCRWRRHERPLRARDWFALLGPQVLLNGAAACVWNPLLTGFGAHEAGNTLAQRLLLCWWNWRDLNRCEYFALPLILMALALGLARDHLWLRRGVVALAVYLAVLALFSPQIVAGTTDADVRYLAPVIPLGLALETGVICACAQGRPRWAILGALVVFGCNLFNGGPWLPARLRSTFVCYVRELAAPLPEPYTPTAAWINQNVPAGASVWVVPITNIYPLMFHAPNALYAWQLRWPPDPAYAQLPAIQFAGREPPDYLIAFGPFLKPMMEWVNGMNRPDVHYALVDTLEVFWSDRYRPELFWHAFTPTMDFDRRTEAVYVFQRVTPPIAVGKSSG
jgi:Dolichyl-phosphate-mannose-protein mannosyltransferase